MLEREPRVAGLEGDEIRNSNHEPDEGLHPGIVSLRRQGELHPQQVGHVDKGTGILEGAGLQVDGMGACLSVLPLIVEHPVVLLGRWQLAEVA